MVDHDFAADARLWCRYRNGPRRLLKPPRYRIGGQEADALTPELSCFDRSRAAGSPPSQEDRIRCPQLPSRKLRMADQFLAGTRLLRQQPHRSSRSGALLTSDNLIVEAVQREGKESRSDWPSVWASAEPRSGRCGCLIGVRVSRSHRRTAQAARRRSGVPVCRTSQQV
jgi:hypothetical protein